MKFRLLTFLCTYLFLALLTASQPVASDIKIAVASNFFQTLSIIARQYEQKTAQKITLISGSTGKHYAQIMNGAPYDAFFAADMERPLRLEQEGYIQPGSRFTYAIGKLVLWDPLNTTRTTSIDRLSSLDFTHVAIANPDLAPYGKAARQVLQSFNIWHRLKGKIVRGENIGQAFQFVKSGNAELGFVAESQLIGPDPSVQGGVWAVPARLHDPIEQQAVLLKNSPEAIEFMAYCQSEEVLNMIRANGYHTPDVAHRI